jgi:phosphomevalonate kinase
LFLHYYFVGIKYRTLLIYIFLCSSSLSSTNKELIFKIASKAHYEAQNNSGSGYDILTGVYGSCIFEKKDCSFSHISFLPSPEVEILFSCGGKGSKTPALVKCVHQWRQNQTNSTLWNEYKENNELLIQCLQHGEIWNLRSLFQKKLQLMRQIGIAAQTEIVPSTIHHLLLESMKLEGVFGCAVAGAGGNDSFYCIVHKNKVNKKLLEAIWKQEDYFFSPVMVTNHGMTITYSILCSTNK